MKNKWTILWFCTLIVSCGNNNTSNNFSSTNSGSSYSSSTFSSSTTTTSSSTTSYNEVSLDEALENTKNNFTSMENRKTIDNLKNTTQLYKEELNVDLLNNKIFQKYVSCTTDSNETFNEYIKDENAWDYYCYFKDENGDIKQRYKNSANDNIWKESSYTKDTAFTNLLLNKIDTSLFEKITDELYSVKTSFLSSEEVAKFTSFYGSYAYFEQDYNYFDITLSNGVISKISYELCLVSRPETSFEHDSIVTVNIDFSNVGNTEFSIPELPVYPEDLLENNVDLDEAINNTSSNYTYEV